MVLSLWFWGRKRDGRRSLVSFSGALPLVLIAVPVVILLVANLINLFRSR
jgi:hypothetical protein